MSQLHQKLPRGVWPLDVPVGDPHDLGHLDLGLVSPEHAQGESFLLLAHLFMRIFFLKKPYPHYRRKILQSWSGESSCKKTSSQETWRVWLEVRGARQNCC